MNLRQLEVFRAVMTTGSVSDAARLLHVSVPAVSRVLSHTETQLGFPLFERIKGRLHSTAEARHLYRDVEAVYAGVRRISDLANELAYRRFGLVSVVSSPSIGQQVVPRAIAHFHGRRPEVHVRFNCLGHEALKQQLVAGAVDLGISMLPMEHPKLRTRTIASSQLVCICPWNHPLANESSVAAEDLLPHELITYLPGTPMAKRVEALFRDHGEPARAFIEVGSPHNACAMVHAGTGIALVDEFSLQSWPEAHFHALRVEDAAPILADEGKCAAHPPAGGLTCAPDLALCTHVKGGAQRITRLPAASGPRMLHSQREEQMAKKRTLGLAVAQMGPMHLADNRTSAVKRLVEMMREAHARGSRFVVFPELALTTFFPRYWMPEQEAQERFFERSMPSRETQPLFDEARELGVGFYLGYAELTSEGIPYNTSIIVGPDGSIRGKYRKIHLPGHAEHKPDAPFQHLEKKFFNVGDLGFKVFDMQGIRMGMCLCNDRRWPETYRVMALQGAEVVVLGYNTPSVNINWSEPLHLRTTTHLISLQANAYQNAAWVAAAAKCGAEDGFHMIGSSVIVAPTGEIVARTLTEEDEVIAVQADLSLGEFFREHVFNFAKHRRPEHYRLIVERTGAGDPVA